MSHCLALGALGAQTDADRSQHTRAYHQDLDNTK